MLTNSRPGSRRTWGLTVFVFVVLAPEFALRAADRVGASPQPKPTAVEWKTLARWGHGVRSSPGTIFIERGGIRFRADRGNSLTWRYEEIQTFYATPRHLVITGYTNRSWRLPGTQSFRFELEEAMPPAVAVHLSENIGKPSCNADPLGHVAAFATLGARHHKRRGGTNGVLRFRDAGIDYVTRSAGDSRSWRWADIQTVANPDPYHFRVSAFLEIYEFNLKQPMSRRLFDRVWDGIYGRGLRVAIGNGGDRR